MHAKQLIEENNHKRDLLTLDNKSFYSDILLYIRLQLSLSEQQSEEILMEMLDHLLDGQKEGKTAKDIFGPDPKAYADEIIAQLPKEKMRAIIPFVTGIIFDIVSWLLIFRGIALLVISQFKEVETTIYPIMVTIIAVVVLSLVLLAVWFVFRMIKNTLFKEKSSVKKDSLKIGLFAAILMAVVMGLTIFIPDKGPSFNFTWWASIVVGCILWLITYFIKRKR
ncbi:DUF1129 family protein [Bacillus sp. FSL K6-3431]|uniref:DUF1129 family protein n=1 Tax=Bacillus sp. FSL K6-3431 TaxID=2921500 RepID=UPI0030F77CEE